MHNRLMITITDGVMNCVTALMCALSQSEPPWRWVPRNDTGHFVLLGRESDAIVVVCFGFVCHIRKVVNFPPDVTTCHN